MFRLQITERAGLCLPPLPPGGPSSGREAGFEGQPPGITAAGRPRCQGPARDRLPGGPPASVGTRADWGGQTPSRTG